MFRGGQQSLLLGAISDDAFLIADGGEHLGLDLLVECGADVFGDIGGGADIVLCQAEVAQSGLGLSGSDQVASGLKSLLDVAGELLASNVVLAVAFLQCRTGARTGHRLVSGLYRRCWRRWGVRARLFGGGGSAVCGSRSRWRSSGRRR